MTKRLAEAAMEIFDEMPPDWRALTRSYPAAQKLYEFDYPIEDARLRLIEDFGEREIV